MEILLVFSIGLLLAVLFSDLASRSILSAAALFLVIGFLAGRGMAGWIDLDATSPKIAKFLEIALFTVLFTDGMQITRPDLHEGWRLASRALLIGMPLTMAAIALLARALTTLNWTASLLLGAALSPTDPIFAAAIIGREEVSVRVRRLLNVESGINDGLALPGVTVLLGWLGQPSAAFSETIEELLLGILIGVAVPLVVIAALNSRFFAAAGVYERLGAISIGLLVFALASMTHANEFLAAFSAGTTISAGSRKMRKSFYEFGETVAELMKLAAVSVFASILSIQFFMSPPWTTYLFVLAVLFIVRPVALMPALAGKQLTRRERGAIVWFGPKGFASLLFGFIILNARLPQSQEIFQLIGLVVLASIVAHSSTDAIVARTFQATREQNESNAA